MGRQDIAAVPSQRLTTLGTENPLLADAIQQQEAQRAFVSANTGEAQRLLNSYFGTRVVSTDTRMGPSTARMLERFQRAEGLDRADGDAPAARLGQLDARTLEQLRAKAGTGGYFAAIQRSAFDPSSAQTRANRALIDPSKPNPTLPQPTQPSLTRDSLRTATVRAGDRIDHLAKTYGVSRAELQRYNPGLDVNKLRTGDLLYLPTRARNAPRLSEPVQPNVDGRAHPGAWTDMPQTRVTLDRGADRPEVGAVGRRLQVLGYGKDAQTPPDNRFGEDMQEQVRRFQATNGIFPNNGIVNNDTWNALQSDRARMATTGPMPIYAPGSPEQVRLFERAAVVAGMPPSVASDPKFQELLRRESEGRVGIPNYTFNNVRRDPATGAPDPRGRRIDLRRRPDLWPALLERVRNGQERVVSTATGLGQLLSKNAARLYPDGLRGIGDPMNEAVGMLRYIRETYRTAARALSFHDRHNWY